MRFSVLSVVADPARPASSAPGSAKSSDSSQAGDIFAALVDAESHDDATSQTQPVTAAQMYGTPADALIPASLFSQVVAEATATDQPDKSGDADTDNAGDGVSMQAFEETAPTMPQVIAPSAVALPPALTAPDAPVETGESASAIAQVLSASRAQARSASLDDAANAFATGTDSVGARGNAEALQSDTMSSATASDMTAKADAAAASLLSSADTKPAESKTNNAAAEGNAGSAMGSTAKSGIAEPANSSRTAANTDAVSVSGDGNAKETGLTSARAKANADAATPASASDVGQSTTFSILHASAQFASAIQTSAQVPMLGTGERLQASDLVPVAGLAVEIANRASAGSNRFEIRLDPPELGRIDVRLDVDRAGQVTSHLTVERADTLDLLRRDASQLQRALQDAGLKTGDSALHFSLRDQSSGNNNPDDSMPRRGTAQILIQTDEAPATDVASRGLGRLLGSSSGLDIRV
jgi:chemotaxis protein MotD